MKKYILALVVGSCCFSAMAQVIKPVAPAKKPLAKPATASTILFKNNNDSVSYGDESINQCIGIYQQKASAEKSLVIKKEGLAFLAANGKRKGVVTLPSGLQYEVIKAGTDNTKPTLNSKVKCHYHGTLINGTVFDSSVDRGEPITFNLNGVIRGWQEALQLMTVGSKWKLYIPSDLAYGDSAPSPTIGPGSTLIFEVELLGIEN